MRKNYNFDRIGSFYDPENDTRPNNSPRVTWGEKALYDVVRALATRVARLEKSICHELRATHQAVCSDWMCTKCNWNGSYSLTRGVMYHGVDWQHCPSCDGVAIPAVGSTKSVKGE